ncbi:MAG TPA: PAS domain-containing protein, partial [Burkholderiales bacterium]|nr:PAS domain-containing protein [Burkholderiales bacterium]
MKIRRLRNKLLLGAVAICVLLALGYMSAVSLIIREQYLDQSNSLLQNALRVVQDGLSERENDLLTASRDLATQKDLGSTIWYLTQYSSSELDREMLFNTYQQLVQGTRKIGLVARASRVFIYNSAGNLISFARFDGNVDEAGYVDRFSKPLFHVITLKPDQESNWRDAATESVVPGIAPSFAGTLPQHESIRYAVIDGSLSIETRVPIMGEAFDSATGKPQVQQLGLVDMVQRIDQSFAEQFARLTNTKVDIFTLQKLSSGSVAAYSTPDWGGIQARKAIFNQVRVAGVGYYQCLMPLYDGNRLVGAIAMLHSREIVRRNTWEMIWTLWLIAGATVLFILPIAWYFATSISRPLTLLSRIFQSLASGKQIMSKDELDHLEKERSRNDELGDLVRSFMDMNDAVNQKIAQINEINASLEQKISERTAALSASEQESRTLIENSPDTIARYDRDCRRIYVNPAFGAMVEGGTAALLGTRPSEYPGGVGSDTYEASVREVFASGRNAHFEMNWFDKTGKEICSHIRLTAEYDRTGEIATVLGIGRDITERMEFEQVIWMQANFDSLTRLPNRQMFHDRLEQDAKISNR